MIFNLRGTNGSGKGWAIEQWLQRYAPPRLTFGMLGMKAPEAYQLAVPGVRRPVFILGPYDKANGCGGCDNFIPYENTITVLRKYAPQGHVLFEGLLIAHSYGVLGRAMEALHAEGHTAHAIFLTTPLEQCIKNVMQRRATRGDRRPLNEKNLRDHDYSTKLRRRNWPPESKIILLDLAADQVHDAVMQRIRRAKQ